MLVINLIDKNMLGVESMNWERADRRAWTARSVLFLGFALMAGGLAGSVVRKRFAGTAPFGCSAIERCMQWSARIPADYSIRLSSS